MTCHKPRRPAVFSESSKTIRGQNLKIEPQTRVSNETGLSCPAGQRDRSLFIVPRQRDNGTTSKSGISTAALVLRQRDSGTRKIFCPRIKGFLGLCVCKYGIFALVGDPLQFHQRKFCVTCFFKSQNPHKAGTLCSV